MGKLPCGEAVVCEQKWRKWHCTQTEKCFNSGSLSLLTWIIPS
jgi:hypothetical protein